MEDSEELKYNWIRMKRMKTAKKMYQFCIDNNYGSGMTKNWAIKHFTLIEQALAADEDVLMCFIGLHNYRSATNHDSNYAYAITNKRIIMAQKRMIGQTFQTVDIDNLNDITMSTGMLMGIVTIDTIKEHFNVAVEKSQAMSINKSIHDVLFSIKQKKKSAENVKVQHTSAADEILKFKGLYDLGVITRAEFEKKKKELLSR